MNQPSILIIEDRVEEAAYIQSILTQLNYQVVAIANDLRSALDLYQQHQPGLCIVDIYLNGKPDGITFVQQVNAGDRRVPFLYLTSNYDNITFNLAKTTSPQSYLLKPYNPLELQYAIELMIDQFNRSNGANSDESQTLFIKRGNGMSRIGIHEIVYIEVSGKYSKIVSATDKFLIQQPLKELQTLLPASMFVRIHRNYILNVKEVIKIDTVNNQILLRNGTALTVSRRYLDDLLLQFKVLK